MKKNNFEADNYEILNNESLRIPQREGFSEIKDYYSDVQNPREIGVVLPVGCGKSGLIAISPFAVKSVRTLVIAPGLGIKSQLSNDFDPANDNMFYQKCKVIDNNFPEPAIIEGNNTNVVDLEEADVVITNIQ